MGDAEFQGRGGERTEAVTWASDCGEIIPGELLEDRGEAIQVAPIKATQAEWGEAEAVATGDAVTVPGGGTSRPDAETAHRLSRRALPIIPNYKILSELGRGGMGLVYRAHELNLDRPCALKMILLGAHADPVAIDRFLAEAQAIARLRHSNIVQIHRIDAVDGLPFFELEHLDGGSLDKRLDGTPWAPQRAAGLVELLAHAVAEARRLALVHRDLKPGNVLVTADGTPKVTDFGLVKSLKDQSGLTVTDFDPGLAQLHGTGTGRRESQASRHDSRHLLARGDPLRVADRTAAIPGRDLARDGGAGQGDRAGPGGSETSGQDNPRGRADPPRPV